MTNQQIIERLASFVGLELDREGWYKIPGNEDGHTFQFNPAEDHNHFQMVLEKVMEDWTLWGLFQSEFNDFHLQSYMEATLPEKLEAIFVAHSRLDDE